MLDKEQQQNKKQSFEGQLTKLSLLASLPIFILLIWLMIYAEISIYLTLLTVLIGSVVIVGCHAKMHQKLSYQFRSLSNLLDAMLQGDYSLRARASHDDKALNELIDATNSLAIRLNKQRIETIESQLLLNTVISHIDVAIIALNSDDELTLTNPAAKQLLGLPLSTENIATHEPLKQLGQMKNLKQGENKVMPLNFSGQQGKFNVHMEHYREAGEQQKLFFITDVSSLLRSEERKAWQALVRVISHEINNSLSPIASISQSLVRLINRQENIELHKESIIEGLGIVSQRSKNLSGFINSYKKIASLPDPDKKNVSIVRIVHKVIGLYQVNQLEVHSSQDVELFIDEVQFEQVLINLIKNAIEAVKNADENGNPQSKLSTKNRVAISWHLHGNLFRLSISDDGTGVSNPDNLFVPFFTTKSNGSGIGLVLCRQIIEAHGGKLSLANKADSHGCIATIELSL